MTPNWGLLVLGPNDVAGYVFFKISILYTKLYLYYRFIHESRTPWLHTTTEVTGLTGHKQHDTSFGVTGMYFFLLNLFIILIYIYYRSIYEFTMPWLHVSKGSHIKHVLVSFQ